MAQQAVNPFESIREAGADGHDRQQSNNVAVSVNGQQMVNGQDAAAHITVGAVSINSNGQIPPEPLASSYEPFIGLNADGETLQQLASAISDAARDQGYIFASAQVPPQSVKIGVVQVQLDPGAIDEIRIIGSKNRRLRRILNKLKCNAARAETVERQILLAGDLPSIRVNNTSYLRENGRGVLVVKVTEKKSRGYAALDNHGPNTLGPIRARLKLDLAGLLTDGDVLTTNVISTVAQPKELSYVSLRYATVLGDGDVVVGFSASAGRTQSGGNLRARDFSGRSRYASAFGSLAIKRSNDLNLWLNAELAYLQVQQSENNFLFQKDEIVTANLNFSGNYNIGFGRIYGGIGVTQGLGILGANRNGDPLNSRFNGSGEFTKANIWVNAILNMGDGFGMRLAGNGQIASRPLLAANEIAIGGPYFGRGYDFSERFGDEGVLGLAELRKEFKDMTNWLDWFQLYGFVDGGYVFNIGTGFGDGTLASAGGGIRAQLGKIDFGIEAATPLTDDRFESGDKSPKINAQVGIRF
ncbi:MAG: ShlB/FhaC/HecB family hemolysin secretion/activation protein [Parasphingorhabdus sp.]|uniref:ShlB/FhaC/HecB family hemolysin secretion/activation protein n=1 Tax=Parasphingorhabdus sp. TaxID=2709688 RepID=UPI00326591B3